MAQKEESKPTANHTPIFSAQSRKAAVPLPADVLRREGIPLQDIWRLITVANALGQTKVLWRGYLSAHLLEELEKLGYKMRDNRGDIGTVISWANEGEDVENRKEIEHRELFYAVTRIIDRSKKEKAEKEGAEKDSDDSDDSDDPKKEGIPLTDYPNPVSENKSE